MRWDRKATVNFQNVRRMVRAALQLDPDKKFSEEERNMALPTSERMREQEVLII